MCQKEKKDSRMVWICDSEDYDLLWNLLRKTRAATGEALSGLSLLSLELEGRQREDILKSLKSSVLYIVEAGNIMQEKVKECQGEMKHHE